MGSPLYLGLGGLCLLWEMGDISVRLESEPAFIGNINTSAGIQNPGRMLAGEGTLSPGAPGSSPTGRMVQQVEGWRAVSFLWACILEACWAVTERTSPLVLLVVEVTCPPCDLELNSSDNYHNEGPRCARVNRI